jgi:hypothetical protein
MPSALTASRRLTSPQLGPGSSALAERQSAARFIGGPPLGSGASLRAFGLKGESMVTRRTGWNVGLPAGRRYPKVATSNTARGHDRVPVS